MDYWNECISEALNDVRISATKEQIENIAEWVRGAHENYGMAHGHDCIPNPMLSEVEELKRRIRKMESEHDKQLDGIRKGVAIRRNVNANDVNIDSDGHVTYDCR